MYKSIILFFLLFISIYAIAQDPSTNVEFNISNKGIPILKENLKDYKVTVVSCQPGGSVFNNLEPDKYDTNLFRFYIGRPYRQEIYEIKIIHFSDTMKIRFQKLDRNAEDNPYFWNAYFYFSIPFQPGYFEITDFKIVPYQTHTNSDDYIWKPLEIDERKLIK